MGDPRDYPDDWFAKLSQVASRPDLLTGVEMLTVINLGHTRGPPNPSDAAMVERLYGRIVDGLQDPRRDD